MSPGCFSFFEKSVKGIAEAFRVCIDWICVWMFLHALGAFGCFWMFFSKRSVKRAIARLRFCIVLICVWMFLLHDLDVVGCFWMFFLRRALKGQLPH